MTAWLDPIRSAADEATSPIEFFVRDDDAGRADDALLRLLDLFADHGLAIDLAVIPTAISESMASQLCAIHSSQRKLGLHQHGYAHFNHESAGRKCEFGPSRDGFDQENDIRRGRVRLAELLGIPIDPIFTPPWNRCTQHTVEALKKEDFQILSRDITAEPLALDTLQHLPVTVDWQRRRKGARVAREDIAKTLADQMRAGEIPVGLMLHHETMDGDDWHDLRTLVDFLSSSAAICPRRMIEFALAK